MLDGSLLFARRLLKAPRHVGAVLPSSRFLARAMVAGLKLGAGHKILELGPGTGSFTEPIRDQLADPEAYVGVERDAAFVALLQQRFPRMEFIADSFGKPVAERLAARYPGAIGAIISGLPFASLPASEQASILDGIGLFMQPGVEFRTFQYCHSWVLPAAIRFRRMMAQRFGPHRVRRVVLPNVPPALVLAWGQPAREGA